ncbi:chloramphenicol-sensitive protein RarD [Quadrisphaera granulorum]|uniref:Chloramphenicol-sensitive protein RarD n=1 Tax=Quadrisphaera granulorum TaxID=317664 RepID=A0A316AD27_9ACTN|nr:EamA family transporter RarD [Quadrisphaera granulorum]PWJ55502.1 chloramphenicol-sensitive protein RarD [Quadrisphaera granulorum]SZE95566.1 chloramphenicol-sensitive protein RarD [Quadrisphaera granulorum]
MTPPGPAPARGGPTAGPSRSGTLLGLSAYLLWGLFPLYFPLLAPAGSVEVLVHRVLWTAVLCVLLLSVLHRWRPLLDLARSRRTVGLLALAAVVIAVNWGVYIYATQTAHVVEASLGYFINPLVTVALAVLLLREKLRRLQWAAVGVGVLAVVVITIDYGRPPWISLVLALSFGTYSLVKKTVGSTGADGARGLSALTSLSAETLLLTPVALVALTVLEAGGAGTFTVDAPWHALLLASTGVVTAVPLLLFAAGAARVPLTTTGLLQYVTPVMQLVLGVAVFHEAMPASRWAGFALVWGALALLTTDLLRTAGRTPRAT